MFISWFGESCFKFVFRTSFGEDVVFVDLLDGKRTGLKAPRIHDALALLWSDGEQPLAQEYARRLPETLSLTHPGEYERHTVCIQGVPLWTEVTEHAHEHVLFRIDAEEISLAHLTLPDDALRDHQMEVLEGVDILCISVGGNGVANAKQAAAVVGRIEPRIVIPMHQHIPHLSVKRDTLDAFTKELGISPESPVQKYTVKKKDLPQDRMFLQPMDIANA
ncbi:MAG: hypothetical protein COT39_00420 [Parcubacteria group bacterium CG08_land_8_20_14_0_20_48_21]|nr:MAG: hypothetical protein AUK21_00150 [Parcubacteria group bacterium CG2_30_48_51]PIS33214.1 MAG: hypothetical protein COT39_00420 [Parcubacteria group bacterium CG08_land_8_20_14_0_20_48_21]PIW79467.1 MAG: hypothetical protein COZ99_00935 [Parcubacteria group bacterium CG_4_8_14_3_um_filter_48_16]PIY77890.1 MAG: hypothetical protein COY83_02775 [Parcubacteria group bacterium CG_4_10_14_0_8_um_filter_48_154]PIZ76952.1 MAG: hypothetical protein COY03_04295 [bacterium CG_4_10_14_0_2_um_filter_